MANTADYTKDNLFSATHFFFLSTECIWLFVTEELKRALVSDQCTCWGKPYKHRKITNDILSGKRMLVVEISPNSVSCEGTDEQCICKENLKVSIKEET